jgi:hypothetical protein
MKSTEEKFIFAIVIEAIFHSVPSAILCFHEKVFSALTASLFIARLSELLPRAFFALTLELLLGWKTKRKN